MSKEQEKNIAYQALLEEWLDGQEKPCPEILLAVKKCSPTFSTEMIHKILLRCNGISEDPERWGTWSLLAESICKNCPQPFTEDVWALLDEMQNRAQYLFDHHTSTNLYFHEWTYRVVAAIQARKHLEHKE